MIDKLHNVMEPRRQATTIFAGDASIGSPTLQTFQHQHEAHLARVEADARWGPGPSTR